MNLSGGLHQQRTRTRNSHSTARHCTANSRHVAMVEPACIRACMYTGSPEVCIYVMRVRGAYTYGSAAAESALRRGRAMRISGRRPKITSGWATAINAPPTEGHVWWFRWCACYHITCAAARVCIHFGWCIGVEGGKGLGGGGG